MLTGTLWDCVLVSYCCCNQWSRAWLTEAYCITVWGGQKSEKRAEIKASVEPCSFWRLQGEDPSLASSSLEYMCVPCPVDAFQRWGQRDGRTDDGWVDEWREGWRDGWTDVRTSFVCSRFSSPWRSLLGSISLSHPYSLEPSFVSNSISLGVPQPPRGEPRPCTHLLQNRSPPVMRK